MKSAFIYSEKFREFKLSENHPYDPVRGKRAFDLCNQFGLFSEPGVVIADPAPFSFDELALVHSSHFLALLRRAAGGEFYLGMLEYGIGTEDCPVFPSLIDFCEVTVGATVRAAALLDEGCGFAFNPLGGFHHAGRAMAEGFCYVNDIALIARRWADQGKKVAVVDIDAHHGNGTQALFYDDPRVLTISLHESGQSLYPFGGEFTEIGDGPGRGYNINIPLRALSDDEVFYFAFTEVVPAAVTAFQPDVVIAIAGVDTFATDPLTHLRMTNNVYVQAAKIIQKLSPRWLALGAGGYNLDNVARGWTLLWAAANGLDDRDDPSLTLGGVFIGETGIGLAGLRDMQVRTSGPDKAEAFNMADQAVDYIRQNVFPILGA